MQKNPLLNFLIVLLCIALGAGIAKWMGEQSPTAHAPPPAARAAPAFAAKDINGKAHNLEGYKDQSIVINFWASWCAPCITEFPILLSAAQNYKNTIFLLISIDSDAALIKKFMRRLPAEYQPILKQENIILLHDPEKDVMQNAFGIYQIPETLVLDRNHTIQHHWKGSSFTKQELERLIHNLQPPS